MKRLLPLLLMLLFLMPALAEDDPTALFLDAHPGYEITESDAKGDTAAAILVQGHEKVLCVAERVNGAWTLTIDNDKALSSHEARDYHLLVDADNAIYWYCEPWDTMEWYGAVRENGVWRMTPYILKTSWYGGISNSQEILITWGNGTLNRTSQLLDENDNIISSTELIPLPASWLDSMTTLDVFDVNQLATFQADIPTVMEGRALEMAAKELLPDYTYVGGGLLSDELQLLMDRPDGARVFVGVTWDGEWKLSESAPLPPDTRYGNENFTDYLYIPDYGTIGVRHWPDGTWGVDFLMPDADGMFQLGRNYISDYVFLYGYGDDVTLLVGDMPWDDLTAIDWSTLPRSFEEAAARIDNSGWAMVNNPNPEDRLHLRVKPDRDAPSQGKYYNGTFVRVLERKGDWTKVDIFGVEGWMMTQYLAFGDDMQKVERVVELRSVGESLPSATLYETPGGKEIKKFAGDARILGIVGDEWFHVWIGEDETGYVRQEELWEGNG